MDRKLRLDIYELCRLCLESDCKLIPILEEVNKGVSTNEKIYSCLLVEILESDKVSKKVCQKCLDTVNNYYSFKTNVTKCQEKLYSLLADTEQESLLFDLEIANSKDNADEPSEGTSINMVTERDKLFNPSSPTSLLRSLDSPMFPGEEKLDNPLDLRCSNIFKTTKLDQTDIFCKRYQQKRRHGCHDCRKTFSSLRSLLKHLNKCHIKNNIFSCSRCNLSFTNEEQLKVHNFMHKEKLVCDKCSYSSYDSSNFKIHTMKHNSEYLVSCSDCGKGFYRMESYKEHRMKKHSHNVMVYKCDTCSKAFQSKNYLQMHVKIHASDYVEKNYQCELCGKTFHSWKGIRRHVTTFHEGSRHKCDICDKEVTSLESLKNHKKTHSGEKSYVCDECGKAFLRLSSLVVHRRIHSGEKPYSCGVCQRSFSQRSSLNVHMRSHTGEKPFTCSYCNKRFSTRTTMNNHMKTHNSSISF